MPVEQKILDAFKNGHPHDYDNPPINIYQGETDEFAFLDAGRDIDPPNLLQLPPKDVKKRWRNDACSNAER